MFLVRILYSDVVSTVILCGSFVGYTCTYYYSHIVTRKKDIMIANILFYIDAVLSPFQSL